MKLVKFLLLISGIISAVLCLLNLFLATLGYDFVCVKMLEISTAVLGVTFIICLIDLHKNF